MPPRNRCSARSRWTTSKSPPCCPHSPARSPRTRTLGELQRLNASPAPELGIGVPAVAPTRELAEEACMIGAHQMFYARLPNVKGTAGGIAFLLDEVMPASPAYRWTLNHTLRLDDPLELFPTFITEAGV